MKRFMMAALLILLSVGCGEPPVPTGPAAEASTADIEITMDGPGVSAGSLVAE
jgi:hypothetical protein